MRTRETLTGSQVATVLQYRAEHPKASYEAIAEATGTQYWLVKRLLQKPRRSTKSDEVREYAVQNPKASPELIAKRLDVALRAVVRALDQPEGTSEIREVNRRKPRSLSPLCSHDRARNLRQHRDQSIHQCCLQEPPNKYLAIAMQVTSTRVCALCPPLGLVVHAQSFDELEPALRAAVDARLDVAIHELAFLPMPAPLESPRPAEIWSVSIEPVVAEQLYRRWRVERPMAEQPGNPLLV